jgi:hypothetical protein
MVEGIGVVLRMVRELNEAKAENAHLRAQLEAARDRCNDILEASGPVLLADVQHVLAALSNEGGDDG